MIVFFTIALVGFLFVVLTSLLGHAHDMGHDLAHDIAHGELGHDGDHESGGHITSIFSVKVIATFMMGFGGAGGVARFYDLSYPVSSLIGLVLGLLVGAAMFYLLEFFARQQANSLVQTKTLVGSFGTVEVAIRGNQPGEVTVSSGERYASYLARAKGGQAIGKGSRVRVVETVGSDLIVEQA